MTTNLVVADKRRTEKTICLAVSPSLKAYGISGRARLFEVVQRVAEVNAKRKWDAPRPSAHRRLLARPGGAGESVPGAGLHRGPASDGHYIDWSTKIYSVYLKYVAPEDIFPYSIDEVFDGHHQLSGHLQDDRPGADPHHHSGYSKDHRHHRRGGDGHQPVPGQGRHGHRGQARPSG